MTNEMELLRQKLSESGVHWWDESDELIDRTKFEIGGNRWSVVNGIGTYGGDRFMAGHNLGLLELRIGNNESEGWLTSGDIMEKIKAQREVNSTKMKAKMD